MRMIEMMIGGIAVGCMFTAVWLSWGGAAKRSVASLDRAHRLFMLVVLMDLVRLGFDVTREAQGWSYWGPILVQVAITATAVYLVVANGREADKAERKAMSDLTGGE